jgi:hypothetical protein
MQFLNHELMTGFDIRQFRTRTPFPWFNFAQFLTPAGFETLYRDFPSLELFEQHSGMERAYGQRPHDRYYLAYEESIYHQDAPAGPGVVSHDQLPRAWQVFIDELRQSQDYSRFVKTVFGVEAYEPRYAWHVGFAGSEVSPHVDAPSKIGTHIFYFNTSEDWNPEWGGATLVLGDKQTDVLNPEFTDFKTVVCAEIRDNHSFLFQNTEEAWHGAQALTCPAGRYRRLFNVIFDAPAAPAVGTHRPLLARVAGKLKSGLLSLGKSS